MAERKKRGLGRGLGALIPDAASNDRPVDVFFSGGDSEEGKEAAEEPKAPRTARTDPAASMQSSRRRKPKTGASEATATKSPKANSSSSEEPTKKTSGSTKKTAGSATSKSAASTSTSASTTSTEAKSPSSSKSSKSTPKTTKTETGSKPASTTKKTADTKAASTKSASTKSVPAADKAGLAGATSGSAESVEIVEQSNADVDTVSTGSEAVSDGEVFESYPGVYTSSGDRVDETRSNSEPASPETTDEVKESSDSLEQAPADQEAAAEESDANAEETAGARSELVGVDSIPDTAFGEIDVDLIEANPRQPRTFFDEDQLSELVHSIREIGVLQPVVVRQKPSDSTRFELIMGERRLRATKDAGLSTIPAIIRYVDNTDLLRDALLENLHRAELNPLEEAAAYGQLLEDFGCTQDELSEKIGRSRPQISNTLRLLRLPPLVQRRVAAGVISAGHARSILGLREPEHMEILAQRIVAEGLSVRASEEAVVLLNRGDSMNVSRATTRVAPQFVEVAERLGDRLDTKVNITVGKKKGKLSVEFANQDDLGRILSLLGVSSESE